MSGLRRRGPSPPSTTTTTTTTTSITTHVGGGSLASSGVHATSVKAGAGGHGPKMRPFLTSIKDYELGEMLGRGGFAFVFKASGKLGTPAEVHQNVAIKIIDKRMMKANNESRKVASEVDIHFHLHHPSILELLTFFEDDDNVYLVMELCAQGELYQYIQANHRPLSEPEARRVLEQVVKGLEYLHERKIMHRDLKLSNILLTEDFDVKIADFGLACRLNDNAGEQRTMCGTPNYISPEVIMRHSYGPATDVWSLGCMFYTVLIGRPPFDSNVVKSTLNKVLSADFELPDYISPIAKDLIQKLLTKEQKKRIPLSDVLRHPWFSPSLPRQRLSSLNSSVSNTTPSNHATTSVAILSDTNTIPTPSEKRSAPLQHGNRTASGGDAVDEGDRPQSFSTQRLKPLRQVTKHGPISILSDGSVEMEFEGGKRMGEGVERLRISGDAETVSVFHRTLKKDDEESRTGSDSSLFALAAKYDRASLPRIYWKRFKYAKRFIELVRTKTPKIIFYSPQAKCILMENGPLADFEMAFYNGIRIRHSNSKRILEIAVPKTLNFDSNTNSALPQQATRDRSPPSSDCEIHRFDISRPERIAIPSHLLSVFRHVQECLRQCLDVEASISETSTQPFPIILKSSNAAADHVSDSVDADMFGKSGWVLGSEVSASAPRYGGSVVSGVSSIAPNRNASRCTPRLHGEAAPRSVSMPTLLDIPPTSPTRHGDDVVVPVNHTFATHAGGSTTVVASSAHGRSVASYTKNGKENVCAFTKEEPVFSFLSGVGWMMRQCDGRFAILFLDGVKVVLDSRRQRVEIVVEEGEGGDSGKVMSYVIDKSLPSSVKTRLAYFPKFLKKGSRSPDQHKPTKPSGTPVSSSGNSFIPHAA